MDQAIRPGRKMRQFIAAILIALTAAGCNQSIAPATQTVILDINGDLYHTLGSEESSCFAEACYEAVINDLLRDGNFASRQEAEAELKSGCYTIYSTVDPIIQEALDREAKNPANFPEQNLAAKEASQALYESQGELEELIVQLAGAVIHNDTGHVAAIIGGREESGASYSQNRALKKLCIGTSASPLTVYAPGFDTKDLSLASSFNDVKTDFAGYVPLNQPNVYSGMASCRAGIRNSVNTITVHALYEVGFEASVDYSQKFGFEISSEDEKSADALALGNFAQGQTPLALASAYSVFPNGGFRHEPAFYTRIADANGKTIAQSSNDEVQVISAQAAFITTEALKQAANGGTAVVSVIGQEVGGKTGDANNGQAAIFAGFTKEYTGAFWFGYDYQRIEGIELYLETTAGYDKSPALFWQKVFTSFYREKRLPNALLPQKPNDVAIAEVDSVSGKAPSELSHHDPRGSQVVSEYFIEGTYPSEEDDIHVLLTVCSETWQLASENCLAEIQVFIDKDIGKLYKSGIMPIDPDFVPDWEADYIKPVDICEMQH
ncbi:MAG: penicillin-binding transpeptidase domain-containing protein [Eubacteriaceae bacterium]|jgi:penicillin-binding protein 1A|nr:penicillin-binding transpeptidase domain-containing protein [Eubacteriaceae bacterium]